MRAALTSRPARGLVFALLLVAGAVPAQNKPATELPERAAIRDEVSAVGLSGTETLTAVGDDSRADGAVLLGFTHFSYAEMGLANSRSVDFGSIGGGTAGFEGSLGGDWACGLRVPFGEGHGPLARLGFRGFLLGNQSLYASRLDLPVGQVGYQLAQADGLFEIAGSAAPVLAGRYSLEAAQKRKLGTGFAWGAHLGLRVHNLHLQAQWTRIEPPRDSTLGALDEARGTVCGVTSVIAICADARHWSGEVHAALPSGVIQDSGSYYLGLSLALATHTQGHERKGIWVYRP